MPGACWRCRRQEISGHAKAIAPKQDPLAPTGTGDGPGRAWLQAVNPAASDCIIPDKKRRVPLNRWPGDGLPRTGYRSFGDGCDPTLKAAVMMPPTGNSSHRKLSILIPPMQ